MELIRLIEESNLFNFAIFLIIIIIIAKRIDIPAVLENMKADIIKNINSSKLAKDNAYAELDKAKTTFDNVDNEVLEISKIANDNAENLKKQMLEDVNEKIKTLKENTNKIINIEEKNLNHLLTSEHCAQSLEIAKKHIINILKDNEELQKKFVEYSLEELEGLWR